MSQVDKSDIVLLGIETSSIICSASLSKGGLLIGEFSMALRNAHSKVLLGLIQTLLEKTETTFDDLDGIAVSAGPGSFTGMRIGYSVAKGIAHPSKLPFIEIPTLEIYALQTGLDSVPLIPIIDARRDQVFTGRYKITSTDLVCEHAPTLIDMSELPTVMPDNAVVCGADSLKLREQLAAVIPSSASILVKSAQAIQAWALHELAFSAYSSSAFSELDHAEPLYMRTFQGES